MFVHFFALFFYFVIENQLVRKKIFIQHSRQNSAFFFVVATTICQQTYHLISNIINYQDFDSFTHAQRIGNIKYLGIT